MMLCRVIGEITSTTRHPVLVNEKLLVVRQQNPDGSITGGPVIALDRAQAGFGDLVLVLDEGNSARLILGGDPRAPVRTMVVGVVDEVTVTNNGET